jgi:hypothetical protein
MISPTCLLLGHYWGDWHVVVTTMTGTSEFRRCLRCIRVQWRWRES